MDLRPEDPRVRPLPAVPLPMLSRCCPNLANHSGVGWDLQGEKRSCWLSLEARQYLGGASRMPASCIWDGGQAPLHTCRGGPEPS